MSNIEITVKVSLELNELINYLNENNFKFHQSFRCIDSFLIKKEKLENKLTYHDLNDCIIFRELIFKNKIIRNIVIKYKQYDDNGNIIKSKQINKEVDNFIRKKNEYLKNGYVELIKMNDYCYTFSKNMHEFIIEHVNSLGTFIEFENHNYDSNIKNGDSIEELIELFNTFNIPYDKSDYFCKKAWLLIKKEKSEYISE